MKNSSIVATHPLGTEIHLEGPWKSIKRQYDEWWLTCNVLLQTQPEEEREPQKSGAEAMAQFAGGRYFEQEASPYGGQDVPIVQAIADYVSNNDTATPHTIGFAIRKD